MALRSLTVGVVAVVLLAGSAGAASAADRYVAPAGVDTGDCADASAPCQSIRWADGQASDGDTIHLAAGTYPADPTSTEITKSGITVVGPQAGIPAREQTGPQATLTLTFSAGPLMIEAPDVVIDGVRFAAPSPVNSAIASYSTGTVVRNSSISGVSAGVQSGTGGITVTGSRITASNTGVYSYGLADNVTGNVITAPYGVSVGWTDARPTVTANTISASTVAVYILDGVSATITANRFVAGTPSGVYAASVTTSVDARNNWWGCNAGPGATGCANITGRGTVTATPYLRLTGAITPDPLDTGADGTVAATLSVNSAGQSVGPVLLGTSIGFATDGGSLSAASAPIANLGVAETTLTAPTTPGTVTVTASLDNATVPLTVEVAEPPVGHLSATSGSLDFASQGIGAMSDAEGVSFTNAGDAPATISGASIVGPDAGDFTIVDDTCTGATLGVSGGCQMSVAFTPSAAGERSAQLRLTSDADPAVTTIDLSGTGVPLVEPASGDFGSVEVGASSGTQPFTSTNRTDGPLRIRSIGLRGADADQFVLFANACRTTISAGASCTMTAALRPSSEGTKSAQIALVVDGIADPVTIALSGRAVPDTTLQVSPGSVDFGGVTVSGASPRRTVTLTNTGSDPLAVTAITTSDPDGVFTVSAGACRTTLAPGASCALSASFRPTSNGPATASVTIRSAGHAARTVTLAGTGVGPALTVSPDPVDFFDGVRVGGSARQVVTLANNGATGAPVDVRSVILDGRDASSYVLYAGSCANRTLAVGTSCEISLYLRPQSVGYKSASLTVNASGQPPVGVAVGGYGV